MIVWNHHKPLLLELLHLKRELKDSLASLDAGLSEVKLHLKRELKDIQGGSRVFIGGTLHLKRELKGARPSARRRI